MTEALANLTQVINQSPQISALAGGHLAAAEAARAEAREETSRRLRETLAKTVPSLDEAAEAAAVDPEERRPGGRPPRRRRPAGGEIRASAATVRDPFEPVPVVDIRA